MEDIEKSKLLLFCGAGVVTIARQLTFYSLIKQVAERLNTLDDKNSKI
ncbi:hypothetical protein ABH307_01780 [Acinetobacter pittii]